MNNIFEKNSLILIFLKIFEIYSCRYFASNKKIAITHLWHAIEPQTIWHLIIKDKVAAQHILGKYSNCTSFGVTMDLLKFANLISKLNFYKLIPYPMDNCLSGRHRPARQTSEKDVLCFHRPGQSSTVHSLDGVSYFLPV